MDLLGCVLGLIPCGRLWPQTVSELVMFATVVVLWLLVLATPGGSGVVAGRGRDVVEGAAPPRRRQRCGTGRRPWVRTVRTAGRLLQVTVGAGLA